MLQSKVIHQQPKPLVNARITLEKYPGKGGWTFAALPNVPPDKHNHFGWIRVYGTIDNYLLDRYNLMPMGNGMLFLPVKAAIRKIIGKNVGDEVLVILYKDERPVEIPEEFRLCLRDEPAAYKTFYGLADPEKQFVLDRIYKSKNDDTRILQIGKEIQQLMDRSNKK